MPDQDYKRCARCRVHKPTLEFSRARSSSDGLYSYCKPCSVEKNREWYEANRPALKERRRARDRRTMYGLSAEAHRDLFERQAGVCAICGRDGAVGHKEVLAVDHCHRTGEVRGLLCDSCNRGIGLLCDDPELLRVAAIYLEEGSRHAEAVKAKQEGHQANRLI